MFNWCIVNSSGPNAGASSGGTGIGGFNDWYIPAKNELAICYFFLKPNGSTNYTTSGTNSVSVAPYSQGQPYSSGFPNATTIPLFQSGNAEEFIILNSVPYWSATTYSSGGGDAWGQRFLDGLQYSGYGPGKTTENHARAVRRNAA
jgi:hypothetical protein